MNKNPKHKFKKGVNYNLPQLPISDQLKAARKLTRREFEEAASKYMFMTWEEMEPFLSDPEAKARVPMMDMMIISLIKRGVYDGETRPLEFLLDRTIGPAVYKKRVEKEEDDSSVPVPMTDEEKISMLDGLKASLKRKMERDQGEQKEGIVIDVEATEPGDETPDDRESEP